MRRWAGFGLAFLTACSSGGSGGRVIVSSGAEYSAERGRITALPDSAAPLHQSFALLINAARAENGVAMLRENAALNAAAGAHARDMVDNDYLAHVNPDGKSPGDRATAADYDWDFMAENIARGYVTESTVVQAWMTSPGHRDNMVDPRPTDFGLGREGSTWVLILGSPGDRP